MKIQKKLQVVVNKDLWDINLVSNSEFVKRWPNDLAVTQYDHRRGERFIFLRGPKVSNNTIAHELLHAYFSYIDTTKKPANTVEEYACEIIGKAHKRLFLLTKRIARDLRKK